MEQQPQIELIGNAEWPRYRIILGDAVWTGAGWDADPARAVIFASMQFAVPAWRDVMARHFSHLKELRLRTELTVTIRVSDGWKLDELAEYLAENACVHLDQAPILVDAAILNFDVAWKHLRVEGGDDENDIFR